MIALFFEVLPRPGHEATYFQMAAALKPELDASGGLLFLDRSRSAARPGWFLSHQFWHDEAAMVRWRANGAHHRVQACARTDILADYRLRVGQVVAWTEGVGIATGEVPAHTAYNDPTVTRERYLVSIVTGAPVAGIGGETFTSVYDAALAVQVVPAASGDEGRAVLARAAAHPAKRNARLCLISRDYGMFDRHEAPQYFEPVTLS